MLIWLRGQDLAFERATASVLTSGKEEKCCQSLYINLQVHIGQIWVLHSL